MLDYEKIKSEILASSTLNELTNDFKPPIPKCADDENYVFISYSHRDYKAVYCDLLEFHKKGVRYWYDYGLPAGEDWEKVVESKIKGAGCAGVVFYLSENLFLSRSVNKEIEFTYGDGETDGKKYFCVNLSGTQPTKIMKQIIRKYDDDELEKFGIDDRMSDLLHAFSNRSTYIDKSADDSTSHITETVAQMVRQFNIVATDFAIEENEEVQKLQKKLDFANTFAIKDGVLVKYLGSNERVVIPETVTVIGEKAFEDCDFMTSAVIPDNVTEIGESAFIGCDELTDIKFPRSLESIGHDAFMGCHALANINLPSELKSIGGSAFNLCCALTNVTIPESVTSIGPLAFYMTQAMEFENGLSYVDKWLVDYEGSDTNIKIKNGTLGIANSAFKDLKNGKKLKIVIIPDSVKFIGAEAFCQCIGLTNIELGSGVESIGVSAFLNCHSLTSITLPSSIVSIGFSAFNNCRKLSDIYYTGTKAEWSSVKKEPLWSFGIPTYTVHCTDGNIKV